MRLAILEDVQSAGEVVLEQLAAAEIALDAGEHAWVGGSVDHPVGGRERLEVARGANVSMKEFDAQFLQPETIALRTGPHQIVDAADRDSFVAIDETLG